MASKTLKRRQDPLSPPLPEKLFVVNKHYSGTTVASYTFTGRGLGPRRGMCQYGAYAWRKMGVKYDESSKHYNTGVE